MAVCVSTRLLRWWLRLLGVFPACDSESGSVFGPILGDPDPVTPSRQRVVPVCNSDFVPADSPAHCLGVCPPIPSPFLFRGVLPWLHPRPDANHPPPLTATRKLRPTAKPT